MYGCKSDSRIQSDEPEVGWWIYVIWYVIFHDSVDVLVVLSSANNICIAIT